MSDHGIWVADAFLWLFAVMMARSREIKSYQVVLISLAGFLLAYTQLGWPVHYILKMFIP
ncbi:hypothetical protein [Streptomyces sp. AA1529]|uniref:hypothetical protein n=1 Tax=Streptomyces sp. AA1529 TaxID=1203257 RepID=UPI00035D68F9|nr:hypothetical protein [Streptomyces sp. AA1529]